MDIQAQLSGQSQSVSFQRVHQRLTIERTSGADPIPADPAVENEASPDEPASLNTRILSAFLETFLGLSLEPVETIDASQWRGQGLRPVSTPDGLSIRFERVEERFEAQSVRLDVSARVRWPDGRESDSQLSLRMDRVAYERRITRLDVGQRRDPLIINLDGQGAALSGERVDFDLLADGVLRAIPTPAAGNALLARDRNGDGVIDDGRELPGALSGDAWATLRTLDENGDGVLSPGDAAFSELRLLRFAADGSQQIASLDKAGIAALALDAVATPYTLTADNGERLGEILSSGYYLRDDGRLGPAQRIDFFL